jgi:RNA polymerase sigma-70 factor (ECF subfamily)
LASGRPEALGELYDRHRGALFRHALTLTSRVPEAEDLVHAVFVKLASTGAELLGVRAPASYLHRVLRTTWIDGQRRQSAGTRATEQAAADVAGWLVSSQRPREDAVDLARAFEALPPLQREVVMLHVVEGFSFREVGKMTGVSLFTAAGRYRLAVGRLRVALAGRRARG